jgi:hypothetical protein
VGVRGYPHEVVLATPDAALVKYSRAFDQLTLEFKMWDESPKQVNAHGVTRLEDDGTWQSDALVRVPELDAGAKHGYGIVDVESNVTLRFVADRIEL